MAAVRSTFKGRPSASADATGRRFRETLPQRRKCRVFHCQPLDPSLASMPRILAELDFAADLKTKNIVVPPMRAVVVWDNADALKGYDTKKEKVILQSLIAEAFSGLKQAQKDIRAAILDFDERLGKKPAATRTEATERVRTFETVCRQITRAQQDKVERAVQARWEMHKKRDAALAKINLQFAAKIVLSAISLSASIAIATLSLGTLAVTLIGTAKTVVSTALLIKDFAEGRDKAAKEVYAIDQALWKAYMGPKMKGKAFKSAKEVAAAVGIPFIESVGKLEGRLEDFLGKSARVDKDRQKLFESANKLLGAIAKVTPDQAGPDNAKRLKTMGDKTTALLEQIHQLALSVDGDNAFYRTNAARCKTYRELNGKALTAGAQALTFGVLVAGIVATAKSVVDIAVALA
jgi:hypothetical protein